MKTSILIATLLLQGCAIDLPNFCGPQCILELDKRRHAELDTINWYENGGPGLPQFLPLGANAGPLGPLCYGYPHPKGGQHSYSARRR